MKKSESVSCSGIANSVTLWTVPCQAPLSMKFSRQEHWSGFPCPPPEDLPDSGIESVHPAASGLQVDSLLLSHWEAPLKPILIAIYIVCIASLS